MLVAGDGGEARGAGGPRKCGQGPRRTHVASNTHEPRFIEEPLDGCCVGTGSWHLQRLESLGATASRCRQLCIAACQMARRRRVPFAVTLWAEGAVTGHCRRDGTANTSRMSGSSWVQ